MPLVLREQHRVIHFVGLGEVTHRFDPVFEGDAKHFQPLVAVGLSQLDEFGNFLTTGATPACPEIDDQGRALPAIDCRGLALQVDQAGGE